MSESGVVKDVEVGEGRADEVDDQPKDPMERLSDSQSKCSRRTYQTMKYRLSPCLNILSRGHWLMYAYLDGSRLKN